jgi:hypothetical protein
MLAARIQFLVGLEALFDREAVADEVQAFTALPITKPCLRGGETGDRERRMGF